MNTLKPSHLCTTYCRIEAVTFNVKQSNSGMSTRRGHGFAGKTKEWRVKIACMQQMKWKGTMSLGIGDDYKLIHYCIKSAHSGAIDILSDGYTKSSTPSSSSRIALCPYKTTKETDVLRSDCALKLFPASLLARSRRPLSLKLWGFDRSEAPGEKEHLNKTLVTRKRPDYEGVAANSSHLKEVK